MKKAVFLFLSCCLTLTLSAQQILWQKTQNYISYSSSIDTTENGGTIVAISTGSATDTTYPNCVVNSDKNSTDIYVQKYDSNHNIIWKTCLGSLYFDVVTAIKYLPDSSTIIAFNSFSMYTRVSNLARISKNGTILWNRKFYDPARPDLDRPSSINDIIYLADNTIITAGHFKQINRKGFSVLKLDLAGNTIWEKYDGGSRGLTKLIKTLDGGFMGIGGDYHDYSYPDPENHISGFCDNYKGLSGNDIMLYKLDNQGNIQWKNCYGGSSEDNGHDIVQLADSSYVFLAGTNSQDMDVIGHIDPFPFYHYDIWLCHISKNGSIIWSQCFGGSRTDIPSRMFKKTNGNILVCGTTRSADRDLLDKRPYLLDPTDLWIFEVDLSTKSITWQYVLDHEGEEALGGRNYGGEVGSEEGEVVFNTQTNILNISSTNGTYTPSGWLLDIKVPNCIYQRNLTAPISSNTNINQTSYINVSSTINTNAIVDFNGGNAINLNQGFAVKNGAVFTAKVINECGFK